MKAGQLRDVIHVERSTHEINEAGTPGFTWTRIATLRAEVVERSTEEFLASSGEADATSIVFRIHYFPELQNADRIAFDGEVFDIEEITPIRHRRGLEVRCVVSEGSS